MSVGCGGGTFRFPEECDEVTLSPYIFCNIVAKDSVRRAKMQIYLSISESSPNFRLQSRLRQISQSLSIKLIPLSVSANLFVE